MLTVPNTPVVKETSAVVNVVKGDVVLLAIVDIGSVTPASNPVLVDDRWVLVMSVSSKLTVVEEMPPVVVANDSTALAVAEVPIVVVVIPVSSVLLVEEMPPVVKDVSAVLV